MPALDLEDHVGPAIMRFPQGLAITSSHELAPFVLGVIGTLVCLWGVFTVSVEFAIT